ncbi:transketolase C-terminal domain-containing protein [Ruminiclostridium cellobioparum]|uniref:transketolase C-terminal domain-containing protein n=1 Tax=Ruminiclostridium cellobioparum TaxID=29355 RepID=UPI0028B1AB4D|nr:transketolase C-terminal domain-containing protein [Ruminiclostridium cellobioparum]
MSRQNTEYILQKGKELLLEYKDSILRISVLQQAADAVDNGVHIGGVFSAVIPLATLYYGGFIQLDIENPTAEDQDAFVLSKGHSVAAITTIYADKGYFPKDLLKNTRSIESIINGHPGPLMPGVHISTGPLGQGLSAAAGFALIGREAPKRDVYCMSGDGELQEGSIWEAVMYAGETGLENLCLIVDRNYGQLDCTNRLILGLGDLKAKFEAFGWRVFEIDGRSYSQAYEAFDTFKNKVRDGRPTVIISNTTKGFGGFSNLTDSHKTNFSGKVFELEMEYQKKRLANRAQELTGFWSGLEGKEETAVKELGAFAAGMNLSVVPDAPDNSFRVTVTEPKVKTCKAAPRNKKLQYPRDMLPVLDKTKEYAASSIVTDVTKVFARDEKVVSIDSDLSSTSGLFDGISAVDKTRAVNVGIAEVNMMCMGEAYAAAGYNAWVSTFCPFFEWRALRRIAIGYQERLEAIESKAGWLSDGHRLDLTFLATAPNLETQTNGATHMGNDDITVFSGIAHLKIIDTSCPQQLMSIMEWIAEGNKGLVYLRIMRAKSKVLYSSDYTFEYGKGYYLSRYEGSKIAVITSGRGAHEALAAAEILKSEGVEVDIIDMPSADEAMFVELAGSGKSLLFAEQNNGYLYSEFQKTMFKNKVNFDLNKIFSINALDESGKARFIHSGTYKQLAEHLGLSAKQLAGTVKKIITG